MGVRKSVLPPEVKLAYWDAVARCLTEEHGLSASVAERAMTAYQKVVSQYKVGDMVYHAPIAQTAAGIVNGGHATEKESSGLLKRTLMKRILVKRKTGKIRTLAKHGKGKGGMTAKHATVRVKDKGDTMAKQQLSKEAGPDATKQPTR